MSYNSIYRRDLFRDHIVVITGGGSGIGRCTAHELAALGADVAIVGRNADKLDAVQAEIRSDGGRVSVHAADIRDEVCRRKNHRRCSGRTRTDRRVVQQRRRPVPGSPGNDQHQGF